MTLEIQVAERGNDLRNHPWWPKPLSVREVVRCNLRECERYVAVYRTAGDPEEAARVVGYCTGSCSAAAKKNKTRRRGVPVVRPERPYVEVWEPPTGIRNDPWSGPGGTCAHRRRYFCPTAEVDGCTVCGNHEECCDAPELHQYDLTVVDLTTRHPAEPRPTLTVREVVRCDLYGCIAQAVAYRAVGTPRPEAFCTTKHRDRARNAQSKARRAEARILAEQERARLARVARTEKRLAEKERRAAARREAQRVWTETLGEREKAHAEALEEYEYRRTLACPRPDKAAWKTPEGAAQEVAAMRAKGNRDAPWLHPYLCDRGGPYGTGCGAYHVGNRMHHPDDEVIRRWGVPTPS